MNAHRKYVGTRWISAAAAVAIVALGGFTLEHGHDAALPAGVVELGEFQAGDPLLLAGVELPELVVTASPVAASATRVASRRRPALLDGDALAPIAVSTASVLLK